MTTNGASITTVPVSSTRWRSTRAARAAGDAAHAPASARSSTNTRTADSARMKTRNTTTRAAA